MKIKELISETSKTDNIFGHPKTVILRHMKKNGYKTLIVNGGSYAYATTLDELNKPKIKWVATDGSEITTDSIKEVREWMDSTADWDDFWERENSKDADLTDIGFLEDNKIMFFSKKKFTQGQEDWETAKLRGDA